MSASFVAFLEQEDWLGIRLIHHMFPRFTALLALMAGFTAGAARMPGVPDDVGRWSGREGKVSPVPVRNVRIEGGFWGPKMRVYKERTIPHSWNYMGYDIRSLKKAAGEKTEGPFNNTWGEANLYKFIETVAHSLGMFPDPELEKRVDEIVDLIGRSQRTNGYAHVFIINEHKPEWDPEFLDGSHDGYVLGHLIEAAIEYRANTGKGALLEIACKAADEAYDHFLGPKGVRGFCGHAELEMALVELSRATGRTKYVELARAFVEWRGRHVVKPYSGTPRAYFQDEVPLRQQRNLDGHAVRATFFATGVADVALATGDADYRLAANRFWDSTAHRRMTITGSTGPRKEHEAFGEDYELPNDGYYESCAACGLLDFAQRMFLLEGQTESSDVLERVLYNAVLHGMALSGTNSNHPRYNSWVCCPPNLSRTLFQVGRYAYATGERDVFVNLYVAGTVQAPLAKGAVGLKVETEYPWDGRVKIAVASGSVSKFAVNLRWPGWCELATLKLNGNEVVPVRRSDRGYIRVDREWREGDTLEFDMEMPVLRVEAHPLIKDCAGKVALQRGPLVYGFEGLDNPGQPAPVLSEDPQFQVEARSEWLGGVSVVSGKTAEGRRFVAVPFYTFANREKTTQEVWTTQRNWKAGDAWWEGQLYRKADAVMQKAVAPSPTEKDAK